MLKMQMLQNMHINNNMHMQLISQLGLVNDRVHSQEMPSYINHMGRQEVYYGPGQTNVVGWPAQDRATIHQNPTH